MYKKRIQKAVSAHLQSKSKLSSTNGLPHESKYCQRPQYDDADDDIDVLPLG
jgi:hypothetical protein